MIVPCKLDMARRVPSRRHTENRIKRPFVDGGRGSSGCPRTIVRAVRTTLWLLPHATANWDAYDSAGKLLGHNRVEKAHGGCVLIEHWSGVEGESGTSLNIYDANRKVWNETWASSHGTLLSIEGGMRGKQMVMIGTHVQDDGRVALHRNIWTPLPDGVHQVWDYSLDGGQTWIVNYDGYLRPAKAGR